MREQGSRWRRLVGDAIEATGPARLVVAVGVLLVLAQISFRAWALYPSWFYLDDYNLLQDATGQRLDGDYLLDPYNSHLMPGGRMLAWLVAESGQLNWELAATFTLALQALAGAAALWMLVTLFGARWGVLVPLSLYLASAMTVPAMMWWTASLNQVPLQCSFFLAVGAWVHYLRGRKLRWLAATTVAVTFGLFFYVKALLIFLVLAFIAVAYFAHGGLHRRLWTVARRYWPAAVVGAAAVAGYLGYYTANVPQPFTQTDASLVAKLADSMLGTAFTVGVVGGPWDWSELAPPNAFADPPAWAVHLSWVVVVLVVLYGALRRQGTMRAWVLLGLYASAALALLVNSRAPTYGRVIGLEYRYLTDAAAAAALCLGLAFLPLRGAEQPSSPRADPLLRVRVPDGVVAALVVLVCSSALVSSVRYIAYWHSDNASDAYLHNLARDLRANGAVDLADQAVPDEVIPGMFAPDNAVARLVPLVSDLAKFPESSPRLAVVAPDGTLHQALIGPGTVSMPGPRADCGWFVDEDGRTVKLAAPAFTWKWWLRIGYLASRDSPLVVTAGSDRIETNVEAGLNSLYVHVEGRFDTVRLDGLENGATMCVGTIEVGQPVPGRRLE